MSAFRLRSFAPLLVVVLTGCGARQLTHPHDLSIAGHQSPAIQFESAARTTRSDAGGVGTVSNSSGCSGASGRGVPAGRAREDEVARSNWLAARHRETAELLAWEEQYACGNLPEAERDSSPFGRGAAVLSVVPWMTAVWTGELGEERLGGATIILGSTGLTAERLQQLVNCHIAHTAALGQKMQGMNDCPLALPGVVGVVFATSDGLEVTVASEDRTTATEIWRRSRQLDPAASARHLASRSH